MRSELEQTFAFQLKALKITGWVEQLQAIPGRRFRFDFAFPAEKLAIELDGGTFTQGRHTRGQGVEDDCVKQAESVKAGWRTLRFTRNQVDSGLAVGYVQSILDGD